MAKFLTGNELNSELEKLFEGAFFEIILISPYVKLHDRYAASLLTKKKDDEIKITIVFGKNEDDISRSMKQEDFNFFKEFPNIEIRYEKRLHAKYYSNENYAILTSMNLYNFSQDNNIEAGIMTKTNLLGKVGNLLTNVAGEDNFEGAASTYFERVIEQSDLLFKKVPEYETKYLGISKKYISSKIEVDKLSDFFANRPKYELKYKENPDKKIIEKPILNPVFLNVKASISTDTKFLSTTALSKELGVSSKDLFVKFENMNWIERKNDDWVLTDLGKSKGAQTKKGQYGEYISWPDFLTKEIV